MDARPLLAACALALGLAGCVAEAGARCDEPAVAALTPWVGRDYLATDPEADWETVTLLRPLSPDDRVDLAARAGDGWTAAAEPLSETPGLSLVRATPSGSASGSVGVDWTLHRWSADCHAGAEGSLQWTLDPPTPGDSARPGQGVHVHTAGFWENGTLFYTNIEALHEDAAWPRASWYAWEGGDALPVYVYDQDRGEMPPLWNPTVGTPADGLGPWAYFTTIPGFNEALKGLSTHTTRVVRLEPEEAYTRPGNEGHPLYGDALVFYIKVDRVVDLPCPEASPACDLPDGIG